MFINRKIENHISEIMPFFPVLTITGPRQSGKTTLVKNIFGDMPYFSMEDLDVRNFAKTDPRAFLKDNPTGMVIDEVQNAPELLSYIQGLVDEDRSRRFVISGSSQLSLLKSVAQSLSGRTAVLELLPFSYPEILEQARTKTLDNMLLDGFYPDIYANGNRPQFFYPNYVKTYLERDVRDLLSIKDLAAFQTFLRLCAGRIGSLFNASQLATEIGISANTIKSWLSVLQASYIVFLLQPYYENIGKRLTKSPKLYFFDTGLACYLLGIESPSQLSRDKMRGPLLENFVVVEALKHRFNNGKESNLHFYRDSNSNEVDLVLRNGNSFNAIEVKSAQTYHPDFAKGLQAFSNVFGDRVERKGVVYAGDFEITSADIKLINYKNLQEML